MTLPEDPERLAAYHIYFGSAQTLTAIHDTLTEIQLFELDKLWGTGTSEFHAVADSIEAIKTMIAKKQQIVIKKAQEYLE